MFIDSQFTWDYDSQMTEKSFAEYTGIEVKQFRETLLLHMGNAKKSLAERTHHKRQYDRRMNERQMQLRESKVASSKALDASLVVTECGGTKSDEHITSSSLGTYITYAVDADIRPVNDQVPFAEIPGLGIRNLALIYDCPALLVISKVIMKKRSAFRFMNDLIDKKEFHSTVKENWCMLVDGYAMFILAKRLKGMKRHLKYLNKKNGNVYDKMILNSAYREAILDEEKVLKQKTKVEWLKEGDHNSAYFHNILKGIKSKSRINFFGTNDEVFPIDMPDSLFKNKVDAEKALHMVKEVSNEEIKIALFDIDDDKALGLNGFTSKFFKSLWETVGKDLCAAVEEIFIIGKMLGELNTTLISLSAFIEWRQICDNIMLAQELMCGYLSKTKVPRFTFKVDIQKAYDIVSWNFLEFCLLKFGYHQIVIALICLVSEAYAFDFRVNVVMTELLRLLTLLTLPPRAFEIGVGLPVATCSSPQMFLMSTVVRLVNRAGEVKVFPLTDQDILERAKLEADEEVKMDNPNITMKEYIRLEEEKPRRRGKVYNWKTATYGKIWDNEDVHDLGSVETEFPTIVFNDTLTSEAALSCEPTVSSLNNDEIGFRISFDESNDEDYMVIFDKNSFSYKIIYVNNLKKDSENDNDKVNIPLLSLPKPTVSYFDDLNFFKYFENEFPAIVYNDAQTSKSDF
ncbi:hypothetical protein Tco_0672119 [Tanacetum coccineum]